MRDDASVFGAKFSWKVDLTRSISESWSKSVLKKMRHIDYPSHISWKRSAASEYMKKFSHLYTDLVMERADYRLDKDVTRQKLRDIAGDPTYEILWFQDTSSNDIGGIVIHCMPTEVRVAYRIFDHSITRDISIWSPDYYAEIVLRGVLAEKGYSHFYHGTEVQPLYQLGLSQFKLSVGAYPVLPSEDFGTVQFTPLQIAEYVERTGFFGYYDQPAGERLTHLFVHCAHSVRTYAEGVRKLCTRAGVTMEITEI